MRIGFLYNHEGAHQIAHSLPIARALLYMRPEWDVAALAPPGPTGAEVEHQVALTPGLRFVPLNPPTKVARTLRRLTGNAVPFDRVSVLRENIATFARFDALVVPEKTSLFLKTRFGLPDLRIIHTRHGAGDRAIGFDKASGQFDFSLLYGPKFRDRLDEKGRLDPARYAITGYAKFDEYLDTPVPRLFDNDRPTVLYNPHPSPALSSWYALGPQILDYFARSTAYNLIFAPHLMLFKKRFNIALSPFGVNRVPPVPAGLGDLSHMRIDLGSPASTDMTYTKAADIYLGDVSSQLYEFLVRPRPCVFVDAARRDWREDPDFAHWHLGPVVHDIEELDAALARAVADPDRYTAAQREQFAYSIDLTDRPSSERAAEAIAGFLER